MEGEDRNERAGAPFFSFFFFFFGGWGGGGGGVGWLCWTIMSGDVK